MKYFVLLCLVAIFQQSSVTKNITLSQGQFLLFKKSPGTKLKNKLEEEFGIKKFSKLSSSYLDRLYYVDNESTTIHFSGLIEKVLQNKKMDVTLSSIEPAKTNELSQADELSVYQYGHYFAQQGYYDEIRDDLIPEKSINAWSSINAEPIVQNIENDFKRDIVVAVLDTGVDISHPDINFYEGEDCLSDGGIPIVDPEDKDGNGKAGDCRGWDFTKKRGRLNMPEDDARNGHGTHISGIISAKKGNGGLAGLSNRIKILPIKVIKRNENLVGSAISFTDQIAKGIEYAIEKNADVINMSYGWASTIDSEIIREHIKLANEKGIFVVSAAGNDGNNLDFYPCNHIGVICVGSNSPLQEDSNKKEISEFSNYGGIVDLFAPGEAILSTFPRYQDSIDKVFDQEGYDYGYGTSQSTPFISLSIAIMLGLETSDHLSKNHNPENKLKSIYARLINTSRELIDNEKWGLGGKVNLAKAVANKNDQLIAPNFKSIPVIKVNAQNEFSFNLPIENFGTLENNISIKLTHSNDIQLDNDKIDITQIETYSEKTIQISGKFNDSDLPFHQLIEFDISAASGFKKSFKKDFIFGTISNANNSKVITISDQSEAPFILVKRRGIYVDRLKVVQDRHEDSQNTDFYYTKFDRQANEAFLTLLKLDREGTKSFDYKLPKRVNEAFFNFQRIDLNYDGEKDYLLGVLIAHTDEEKEQGMKDYIEFHYLNSELKPLFNKHVISFLPKISAITGFRNINLYQHRTQAGQLMALPLYIFSGGIADIDLPEKPWLKKKEPFQKRRLYYAALNEAEMVLEERVVNTYDFDQSIRRGYNVKYFENITPLALGEQSKDAYYRGENTVYFSAGFAQQQRTLQVTLNNEKPILTKEINFGSANITSSMLTRELGNSNHSYDYFNTYLKNGDIEFFDASNEEVHHFDLVGADFRGVKTAFHQNGDLNLLLEFGNHFRLYQRKNGQFGTQYSQYPLGRVSFINGMVFKELTKNFVIHTPNDSKAALFIDSSAITRGHVYTVDMSSGEMKSSLKNNTYLNYGCTPLAPGNFENRTYLISICEEDTPEARASENRLKNDIFIKLNIIR